MIYMLGLEERWLQYRSDTQEGEMDKESNIQNEKQIDNNNESFNVRQVESTKSIITCFSSKHVIVSENWSL